MLFMNLKRTVFMW